MHVCYITLKVMLTGLGFASWKRTESVEAAGSF